MHPLPLLAHAQEPSAADVRQKAVPGGASRTVGSSDRGCRAPKVRSRSTTMMTLLVAVMLVHMTTATAPTSPAKMRLEMSQTGCKLWKGGKQLRNNRGWNKCVKPGPNAGPSWNELSAQPSARSASFTWLKRYTWRQRTGAPPAPNWERKDAAYRTSTQGMPTPLSKPNWRNLWQRSSTRHTLPSLVSTTSAYLRMMRPGWNSWAQAARRRDTWLFNTWPAWPDPSSRRNWSAASPIFWRPGWRTKHKITSTCPRFASCCRCLATTDADNSNSGTPAIWLALLPNHRLFMKTTTMSPWNHLSQPLDQLAPEFGRKPPDLGKHLRATKLRPTTSRLRRKRPRRNKALRTPRWSHGTSWPREALSQLAGPPLRVLSCTIRRIVVQFYCFPTCTEDVHPLCKPNPLRPRHPLGRSGPKSGGELNQHKPSALKLLIGSLFLQVTTGVRLTDTRVGSAPRLDLPEANPTRTAQIISRANHNGVFSPPQNVATPARKRSFIRAQNRARQHGQALYRGRWYSSQALGVTHHPRPLECPSSQRPAPVA